MNFPRFQDHEIGVTKKHILVAFGGFAILLIFVALFTYFYFARDLKSKETVMNRNNTGVLLLDHKEEPFFSFYQAQQKTFVPLDQIPNYMQQAVIAMEDKEFYSHPGFSIRGIIRAFAVNFRSGEIRHGGSTITQQLVKNALLNPRRDFLRKYQELILAQEIERRFTKNEILEMYLNSVYFGEGAFGVEEASLTYFNKSAKNLTLAESSLLTALLKAPSSLSPVSGDQKRAIERQKIVLQEMASQGFITSEEKERTEKQKLVFKEKENFINDFAPHFALMVLEELEERYGGEEKVARSGFKVKTTLNLEWQKHAEVAVKNHVNTLARNRASNGGAVAIDPKTGEVRTLVGSKDWFNEDFGKFNIATALRQPGSAFKPIVYAAGFEQRVISPATILRDEPTTFTGPYVQGSYTPRNYDGRFRGPVLARRALANSLNVPSVEVMSKVGLPEAIQMAQRIGITSLKDPSNYGLSLVLGGREVKPIELTNAYAAFANGGEVNKITTILEIKDKNGQTIYTATPEKNRAVRPETAFLISSILSDSQARQEVFGNALDISRPAAVKTGTTQDFRDAWTVGYTPSLAIGVWVGNNDNTPMDSVAGSLGAAPIWRSLMERFLQGTPVEAFSPPPGIIPLWICGDNGLRLENKESTSSAKLEYFIPGTEPSGVCIVPTPTPTPTPVPSPAPTPENQENKEGEGKPENKPEEEKKDKNQSGEPILNLQLPL